MNSEAVHAKGKPKLSSILPPINKHPNRVTPILQKFTYLEKDNEANEIKESENSVNDDVFDRPEDKSCHSSSHLDKNCVDEED